MINSNNDLKIYINETHNKQYNKLYQALSNVNYFLCDKSNINNSNYILFNDTDINFDINMYRSLLKFALDNDKTILFLSKGIPYFYNQTLGTLYLLNLSSNDNTEYNIIF